MKNKIRKPTISKNFGRGLALLLAALFISSPAFSAQNQLWAGIKFLPKFMWRSAKQVARPKNLAILGATALASYAVSQYNDPIAAGAKRMDPHQSFTGFGRDYYGAAMNMGLPQMGTYAVGQGFHKGSLAGTGYALTSSFLLERMVVGGLQFATHDGRPDPTVQGNPTGGTFPSGHSTSGAAFAGVIQARHGYVAATPFYAAALYTGWSRIADGAHRPHEVIAGLGIGYVIGLASGEAWNEVESDSLSVSIVPQINPGKEYGLAFQIKF